MATNHEVGSSNLSGRAIKTSTYDDLKNPTVPQMNANRLQIDGVGAINGSVIPPVCVFLLRDVERDISLMRAGLRGVKCIHD